MESLAVALPLQRADSRSRSIWSGSILSTIGVESLFLVIPPFFLAYSIRSSTWLTHTPFSNILRYLSGFGWTGNLLSTFQRLSTRVRSPIVFPDFALKVSHFLSWFSFSFGVILLQLILKPMFRFRGMSFLPLFHLFVYFTISKSSLHTPPVLLPPPWVVE